MKSISLLPALFLFVALTARAESVTSFAVIGDAGAWTLPAQAVQASILSSGVRRLVMPGDNLYEDEPYASVWDHWSSKGFSFDVVAIGNHTRGYAQETAFFKMPNEYYSRVPVAGVRFLVLNSDNSRTAKIQSEWLDRELDGATDNLIFVVYHHPPYTLTSFHSWEEKATFHRRVRPILWKHRSKITALLLGHDHAASLATFNDDLPAVTSGAVAGTRKPELRNDTQDDVRVQTEWVFDGKPAWTRLDVEPAKSEARVRFIRASDSSVKCSVTLKTGARASLGADCRTAGPR